ncbi:hypothetical protein BP5796_13206 [Coleophoma crateriformis]|uniref:Amine oxidase domain-containing protein n=1 Tax=Coleophoma crateriformis TaxID=565419 RepID=A0A3D8Q4Q3_9HELO|nr:hypothetical protein BP5796_13206 [Coleophoma crateriformis]
MTPAKTKTKHKVAVVGSGMAGLVTAYLLHRDVHQRYSVTVFESGKSFSLDAASVSIQDESQEIVDRIDVPMRAFAEGYYKNLISMYKYLGIRFHSQRFVYSFRKRAVSETLNESSKEGYFIYSSNNHRFLPTRPEGISLFSWFIEIMYVAVCYLWWSLCCFWNPPLLATNSGVCESLDEYVRRIMLPLHFVNFYLLPLLSSVATCSHEALLQFPATDLTEYRRRSAGGEHYTVSGVHEVQTTLGSGLEARFSAMVTKVEVLPNGRLEVVWNTSDNVIKKEIFDQVVLAVAPDIAGRIFRPLEKAMAQIPTTMVQSTVQGEGMKLAVNDTITSGFTSKGARAAETIHLRTSASLAQTESIHVQGSGATVTTCPFNDVSTARNMLVSVKFLRALRTPRSRRVVNNLFGENLTGPLFDEKQSSWRNGDDKIWLVGGWCWDGMVLLEGCVVSAMRVALALDVDIPWRALKT